MIAINWANPLEGYAIPFVNVAFIASMVGATVMTLAAIPFGKRRPVSTPLKWGDAMLASVYAFATMFLAFGTAPNEWLLHADKDLGWTRTKVLYGPGGILKPQSVGGWNPITLQYEAVRDIVVVLIYVYFFGLMIYIWSWWQNRGERSAAASVPQISAYGRPLVRKN